MNSLFEESQTWVGNPSFKDVIFKNPFHLFRTHFRLERWVFQKMGKKGSKDGFYKWERWVWSRKFFLELMLTQNLKEIFVYNDFYVSLWS